MKLLEVLRSKPMVRKGLIAGGAAVLVYTLFGFLALPPILKSVLSKTLSETLHRKAGLHDIRVNPLDLSVSVRGLTISERDAPGTWISAEEVFANLQPAPVIRGGSVLSEIRLSRPYVNIVRRPDGSYNFTDLIDEFTKKPAKESKPLKYSINNMKIVDGSIDFDDGPKKTRHGVRGIHVAVPFLSNLRYYVDRYVQPSFAAVVNGKPVGFKGKTKPFSESLETTFDVNISDLDIPHYAEYPKYLVRAYKVEKFPKPRNIIGMAKDLPVPEMEKLMLAHLQVTDDDLRQLALERASHVRDRLVASGKVEPARIFLVEPKTLPPERKEKLRDSRVDFRIK